MAPSLSFVESPCLRGLCDGTGITANHPAPRPDRNRMTRLSLAQRNRPRRGLALHTPILGSAANCWWYCQEYHRGQQLRPYAGQ